MHEVTVHNHKSSLTPLTLLGVFTSVDSIQRSSRFARELHFLPEMESAKVAAATNNLHKQLKSGNLARWNEDDHHHLLMFFFLIVGWYARPSRREAGPIF
jgi:hypothetical protein